MAKILLVEDDIHLNKTMCTYLSRNGFEITGCYCVKEAYETMYENSFDLIISDIMLPEIDGFEFAKEVRNHNVEIPILFLSARDDMYSKQKGYFIGIDDYLVKPVNFEELVLKIGALLRRANIKLEKRLVIGNLILNLEERSVILNNEEIVLTIREFDILFKLLSYPKKTFTRIQLMEEFWNNEKTTTSRTIDVYITKLRDKFSMCDDFEIVTVHGLGYKVILNEKN